MKPLCRLKLQPSQRIQVKKNDEHRYVLLRIFRSFAAEQTAKVIGDCFEENDCTEDDCTEAEISESLATVLLQSLTLNLMIGDSVCVCVCVYVCVCVCVCVCVPIMPQSLIVIPPLFLSLLHP